MAKIITQNFRSVQLFSPAYFKTIVKALGCCRTIRICADEPSPRCDKIDDKRCEKVKRMIDLNRKPMRTSMWEEPDCCKQVDCGYGPRYDDMYWKSTDKNKRKYMQTWVECPDPILAPVQCKQEDICDPPPVERRTRKKIREVTACDLKPQCVNLTLPCPKFKLDKCRPARAIVNCRKNRIPLDCKKYCTPYPSFSECQRKVMRYVNKTQCRCQDIPMLCEVNAEYQRQKTLRKVPGPNDCPC